MKGPKGDIEEDNMVVELPLLCTIERYMRGAVNACTPIAMAGHSMVFCDMCHAVYCTRECLEWDASIHRISIRCLTKRYLSKYRKAPVVPGWTSMI